MPILQPELLLYISAGALVGFAVGLTGVGGGSLMTPLLLLFGFPPQVAIGTDLLPIPKADEVSQIAADAHGAQTLAKRTRARES